MHGKEILLLVNTYARQGRADVDDAVELLRDAGFTVRQPEVDSPGQITDAIESGAAEVERIVLGGGDGTLHRAAPALLRSGKPLGILPLGTANDLARTLGIPAELTAAAEIIAASRTRAIDLGCINAERWFFNVAHIGLGAKVSRSVSGERKRLWGRFGYLRTFLQTWRAARPFTVEVTCDGRRERFRSIEVAVGNGRNYGGGMTVAAEARIDDGELHLFSLDPQGVISLAALLPALAVGDYKERTRVKFRSGREIAVRTVPPQRVVADGEENGMTPARFTLCRATLRVFVPEKTPETEKC